MGRRPESWSGPCGRGSCPPGVRSLIRWSSRTVPAPDDPVGEAAALLSLDRPELLQLLAAGARALRQGVQHLKDVGELLRVVGGSDELGHFLLELVPQPGAVLLGIGRVGDRLQPLSPDDLGNPVTHELALGHRSPPRYLR